VHREKQLLGAKLPDVYHWILLRHMLSVQNVLLLCYHSEAILMSHPDVQPSVEDQVLSLWEESKIRPKTHRVKASAWWQLNP
jgi:hypothetical protein